MIAEGALDKEELAGFNVHNKDISWSGFDVVKLDPSNRKCVVNQVDVEEWIEAGKGI
jgi:hypothetical protein